MGLGPLTLKQIVDGLLYVDIEWIVAVVSHILYVISLEGQHLFEISQTAAPELNKKFCFVSQDADLHKAFLNLPSGML